MLLLLVEFVDWFCDTPPAGDNPVPPTDSLRAGLVIAAFVPPFVGREAVAVLETLAVETVTDCVAEVDALELPADFPSFSIGFLRALNALSFAPITVCW